MDDHFECDSCGEIIDSYPCLHCGWIEEGGIADHPIVFGITGEELDCLEKYGLNPDIALFVNKIRSRPLSSALKAERERVLDDLFPPNSEINSNGDLNGGWEIDPKALFRLKKEIQLNPQFTEEPEAEVIEVIVLAIKAALRTQQEQP
jgi:hypothetical protein